LFQRILEAIEPQQQLSGKDPLKTGNVKRIKVICDLGKMHARAMRDSSLEPTLLASERKNYETYKRDAILSANRLTDNTLRDSTLRLIIDLCVYGGDDSEAKHLQNAVEADSMRREILEEHPGLAS
jgi:hypothetical protein